MRRLREKELKGRAKKKDLVLHKSPIDGTFMIMLEMSVPLFPETIKSKPWGKRDTIYPPEEEIYEGATFSEAEHFIRQFVPPWSPECDREIAASINSALADLARAGRASMREKTGGAPSDVSNINAGDVNQPPES